uniref:THAP-type domain-containing protein n=1 Tax=Oncorhynchus kisutch TaxID=8019 RepID=A0A8C7D9W8_ONCKI
EVCINHSWIYSSFDSCNCDCKGWNPQQNHRVCSVHFEDKYICGRDIRQRLTPDAVPTIFDYPKNVQNKVVLIQPLTFSSFVAQLGLDVLHIVCECNRTDVTGETQIKIQSGSAAFFKTASCYDYAPGSGIDSRYTLSPILTQIKDAWEWLGMDIRGPLPLTPNGHQHVLTLTDFYSKWVEAFPLRGCSSTEVAQHVAEVISHFVRSLPRRVEINVALKSHLKLIGSLDLTTQTLISRMVSDLVKDHPYNWDVCLPAKVFSLCFKEHPKTKQRPFSLLCCKGPQPVTTPRDLSVRLLCSYSLTFIIMDCNFN